MTYQVLHAVNGKTIQGASWLTERKEFEIGNLAKLRLMQLKSWAVDRHYDRIIIADVFSGSGENVLYANDDPIDGSPMRLLWALNSAINTKKGPNPMALGKKRIDFLFSDIRQDAITHLKNVIDDRWDDMPNTYVWPEVYEASQAIRMLIDELIDNPRTHLILVLDPNRPKAFPRDEVLEMLARHSARVDVIPYISATAINRCLRHRESSGANYDWWLSTIDSFDSGFVLEISKDRKGWIREPVHGDPQKWLLFPTFPKRFYPTHDWARQGYVTIESPRGIDALRTYSSIKEAA